VQEVTFGQGRDSAPKKLFCACVTFVDLQVPFIVSNDTEANTYTNTCHSYQSSAYCHIIHDRPRLTR